MRAETKEETEAVKTTPRWGDLVKETPIFFLDSRAVKRITTNAKHLHAI